MSVSRNSYCRSAEKIVNFIPRKRVLQFVVVDITTTDLILSNRLFEKSYVYYNTVQIYVLLDRFFREDMWDVIEYIESNKLSNKTINIYTYSI